MRGAIVDDRIAQRDVIGVMKDASGAASGDVETFEDVMAAIQGDGIGSSPNDRAFSVFRDAANGDFRRRRSRFGERNARIRGVSIDFDDIARFYDGSDGANLLIWFTGTNLVRRGPSISDKRPGHESGDDAR